MKLSSDRLLRFQSSLVQVMSDAGSLQDLLDIAHKEFQRPMFIKGDGSSIYAITDNYDDNVHPNWPQFIRNMKTNSVDADSVRTVSEDPEFNQAFSQTHANVLRSPYYGGMVLHANVWLHKIRVCEVVVLENGKPFLTADTELMDVFVEYVQLHVSLYRNRYMANRDLSLVFIDLLEEKSVSPMEFMNINSLTGWAVEDELAVLLVSNPSKKNTPMLAVIRDKLKTIFPFSITFIYHDDVVSVVNISRSGGYREVCRQSSRLVSPEKMYSGISFEYTGMERTREQYHMALLAASIAGKLGKHFIDMYGAAHIRISERIHAIPDLQVMIHPDLLRLDSLDPQRTSHYLETLYAFLLCGGNYTDTANYLGLHRNSLIYRMNRIQSILRSDLNDVHNRHFLLISYLLMGISF